MSPEKIILDSFALIAYFEQEEGASKVVHFLERAERKQNRLLLTFINWGEIYYAIFRSKGESRAEDCLLLMDQLPIELVGIDRELVYQASRIKGQYAVAYGDCFAAALAKREECPVLTGDKEFQKLNKEIQVSWI